MHLLSRAAASETAGIVSPGCSGQLSVTAGAYVPACSRADAPGPPLPACLAAALLAPAVAAASAAFLRLPALLYFSSPDGREQAVEVHGPCPLCEPGCSIGHSRHTRVPDPCRSRASVVQHELELTSMDSASEHGSRGSTIQLPNLQGVCCKSSQASTERESQRP